MPVLTHTPCGTTTYDDDDNAAADDDDDNAAAAADDDDDDDDDGDDVENDDDNDDLAKVVCNTLKFIQGSKILFLPTIPEHFPCEPVFSNMLEN